MLTDSQLLSRVKRQLAFLAESGCILAVVLDPLLVCGHVGSRAQGAGRSMGVEERVDTMGVAILCALLDDIP